MKFDFQSLKHYHFFVTLILVVIFNNGCKDIEDQEIYQPPEWAEGKLFTQIEMQDDLNTFREIVQITGYDTIINTSGSYTVFAPTDEAFDAFFQSNPEYRALMESEESSEKLNDLIEYQIIFNAWTEEQFQSLDIFGWVDDKNKWSEPRAYKRKTLLREDNEPYPSKLVGNKYKIVNPSEATKSSIAFTESNKYAPVYFDEFFDVFNLSYSDYEYYYNREFEPGNIYFAGAKILEQMPAENGFVYKTDKVITPLLKGEDLLKNGHEDNSYDIFLDLINEFSEFNTNMTATNNQPGAKEGLAVDTLYNLRYPELRVNIHNEQVMGDRGSYVFHYGLLAPTNQAFQSFINQYLSQWGGLEAIPIIVKENIVNSHMSYGLYESYLKGGFFNGVNEVVHLENEGIDVIQKTFGSNCTFLGINKVIVPRVIKSVSQPMYLTTKYETLLYAAQKTKVLSALKKPDANYAFYLPSDEGISYGGDSSLFRIVDDKEREIYHFEAFNMAEKKYEELSIDYLKGKILNQIATSTPNGLAKKEYLRTLGGNYIIVNNENGTVSGTEQSKFGYKGDSSITITPEKYQEETDNGEVYIVKNWFSFSAGNYFGIFSQYAKFFSLLSKAGLYDPSYYRFPVLIPGEYYTVFVPTDSALTSYGADTLALDELRSLLKYHFIKGELIFTDGRKPAKDYVTLREDESSTQYNTVFSKISLNPQPDVISIPDKNGNAYLEISNEKGRTNRTVWYDNNQDTDSEWDFITTGVIHIIDKVLVKDSLQ